MACSLYVEIVLLNVAQHDIIPFLKHASAIYHAVCSVRVLMMAQEEVGEVFKKIHLFYIYSRLDVFKGHTLVIVRTVMMKTL